MINRKKFEPYTKNGILNWSAYSRDNIRKPSAKLKVGDKVKFTVETEIVKVGTDCDGTVLYGAEHIGYGWTEEDFVKVE